MKFPFSPRRNQSALSVPSSKDPVDPVEGVLLYHEETKHHFHRFARSLGYLDWDTQPDPFRAFEGAPVVPLPRLALNDDPLFDDCLTPHRILPVPLSISSISRFFRNALAISAWKRYGAAHWALRVNPSSGNLHPTEGYAVFPLIAPEIAAGVYHYRPREHSLEQRAELAPEMIADLLFDFPDGSFLVGLTSIHWREAWKYGERAYRYCQHDTGHALAALGISAAILGWRMVMLEELADTEVAAMFGLDRAADFEEAEDEDPDLVAAIIPSAGLLPSRATLRGESIARIAEAPWRGKANRLSESHVDWEIIPRVAACGAKPRTEVVDPPIVTTSTPLEVAAATAPAETIVQQRRSAVALDGMTTISGRAFYRMLQRTLPEQNPVMFDLLRRSKLSTPRIHLGLFVHRVENVAPGLYFLVRNPSKLLVVKATTKPEFEWLRPEGCPEDLPLYLLERRDAGRLSAGVSCGQDIAGDGAFSLGMIAEFEPAIRETGAWLYRRLFWEAGIIGQILYLEAEAAGIRGTGIGCYFDDPVHETFGLQGKTFQSLYHFTMGGPVWDERITTEPAYNAEFRT